MLILPQRVFLQPISVPNKPSSMHPFLLQAEVALLVPYSLLSLCCRYYNTFLLPAVRDDIAEHKRLNYHLYRAVKKALFRPAAFFKVSSWTSRRSCTTLFDCLFARDSSCRWWKEEAVLSTKQSLLVLC